MRIVIDGVRDNLRPDKQQQLVHDLRITLAHYHPHGMDSVTVHSDGEEF